MDFLQQVGAEISLTTQLLHIGHCSFPLNGQERGASTFRRLANVESGGPPNLDREGRGDEPVDDWEGTVELAETVTVPPLSVRIARCRIVRRNGSTVVKVPRNQVVLVDPEGLPGIIMAREVATLENCNRSSLNVGDLPPFVVTKKSSLVDVMCSPPERSVAGCDGRKFVTEGDVAVLKTGLGEYLPELPEGGLPVATTSRGDDLQAIDGSRPVENWFGNQVDTHYKIITG
jgi:hypothetical protein